MPASHTSLIVSAMEGSSPARLRSGQDGQYLDHAESSRMLESASAERQGLSNGWRRAREAAVRRGVYPARAPFGYLRVLVDGKRVLAPDPLTAKSVRGIFEEAASGTTLTRIAGWLEECHPKPKAEWSREAVAYILGNRAYLGEARAGSVVNRRAHPPIVSLELWKAAQASGVASPAASGLEPARSGLEDLQTDRRVS